jgi:photosystem II stability/assembly factor-like uncharacterized protein
MKLEDRVRRVLRDEAARTAPANRWDDIERGGLRPPGHQFDRRPDAPQRALVIVVALGVFAAILVWFIPAFSNRGHTPVTANALLVGRIQVFAARDVVKVYGVVSNDGPTASGAAISCSLTDAAGRDIGTVHGTVEYIPAGERASFVLGGSTTGTTTAATCTAAPALAMSPPSTAAAVPVYSPASLAFSDPKHGVIAGWFGVPGTPRESRIETTSDGGRSWRIALRLGGDTNPDVEALDATHIWVLAGPCAMGTCDRTLRLSSDGGETWTRLSSGPFERISFASATEGWAVGHVFATGQSLQTTTDGGHTWRSLPVPCPRSASTATDISFPAPGTGWLLCTGEGGAGNEQRAVLETTDSGGTWAIVAASSLGGPGRSGLTTSGYPTGVTFDVTGAGWMWQDRGTVLATGDGGRTWRSIGMSQPDVNAVTSIWFPRTPSSTTQGRGFALRSRGDVTELLVTSDGGNTWEQIARWG